MKSIEQNFNEQFPPFGLYSMVDKKDTQYAPFGFYIKLQCEGISNGFYWKLMPYKYKDLYIKSSVTYNVPTWQQLFDYFDDEFKLRSEIVHFNGVGTYKYKIWTPSKEKPSGEWDEIRELGHFHSKYEARVACLKSLIEIYNERK